MDDHRLVRMALEQGLITRDQLEHAQREQKALADRGVDHDLWFLIQDLGFVSDDQARRLRKGMSSATLRALEVEGYTIQGRLGSGGMGDVFRARNAQGHEAAVKLLSSRFANNQEYQDRFSREARATLRLRHPHIVASTAAGDVAGCRYLMMELVEGPSLKARIAERGPITDAEALALLGQIGDALRYAWSNGVLHRDVKPANIILGRPREGHDEPFCAKICDFGLAKVWQRPGEADEELHGQLTGAGLALGTPHYMSPEQASGEADLDQRSDIYGLGASLYHALLGKTLYSGKSSAVIMYKQVTERLDLGELRRTGHSQRLVALLERMLVKDRIGRVSSWDEVLGGAAELASARKAGVATQPAAAPPRRGVRGLRLVLLLAVLAVLAAAAAGWWLMADRPAVRTATAATFHAVLADAAVSQGRVREVRLAPGRYQGPWRLGAVHAGLVLRAAGPGVELGAPPGGAVLRCEPGCESVVLDGVALLSPDGAPVLEVLPGARLALRGCTLIGTVAVGGGLDLESCRVDGGLDASPNARLRVQRSRLAARGRPAVAGEGAVIELSATGLSGPLAARGGSLHLAGVAVDAAGAVNALDLAHVIPAEFEDCAVSGASTALRAAGCTVPRIQRLTLAGGVAAAVWSGPVDPAWRWEEVRADPAGTSLPGTDGGGAGADPRRLPPP